MDTLSRTRALTLDDYRSIWKRRKWWFVMTAFLSSVAAVAGIALLPNVYRSESMILLQEQKISENYVKPLSNDDVEHQLAGLIQEALSRTRMEWRIRELGLYPDNGERIPDDLIDLMRSQTDIQIIKGRDPRGRSSPYALQIAFHAGTPELARRVTNELTSFFVEEKLRSQEQGAQETLRFLQGQMEAAKEDLELRERTLNSFKQRYDGQLPLHEQLTLQTLVRLQSQLQASVQALERSRQDLETLQLMGSSRRGATVVAGVTQPESLVKLEAHLQSQRAQLADLEGAYKPNHPDVIKVQSEIAHVEKLFAEQTVALAAPVAAQGSSLEADGAEEKKTVVQLSPELLGRARTLEAEIVARSEEKERLETQISKLQGNLQAIPLRAQQFADLQRSFEAAKGDYENLQDKIRETELASKVERRLQGQRFRVQDFASLPDHPYQPDRLKLNLAGVAAGMMLGVVLAGGLELMDTSIKSDEDLIFYTELKNLAVIPLLPTRKERGRALFRRIMGWTAGVISVLGSGTLLYYLYFVRM